MHKKEAGGKVRIFADFAAKIQRKVMMHHLGVSGQGFGHESDES